MLVFRKFYPILVLLMTFSCSTDLSSSEDDLKNIKGELSISVIEISPDCLTITFYFDNNFNSILDSGDEEIFSFEKCSINPQKFYFFQDAPSYACSNGGIQIFLFLDLNNDGVYQNSEQILDIQTFCYP